MPISGRVTVTLRSDLLEQIDKIERNRSRFIAEAVERELRRRRQEGLIRSVTNPHPDTTALADVGLADWTTDLPEENDLVDLSAGTRVRWVEGRGWIEESS
jgi:hypothetical protein